MVVLQATQDIRKVSLWLGHSSLTTTEVYVRADPTEKLEAIEAVVPPSLRKGKFRAPDKLLWKPQVPPPGCSRRAAGFSPQNRLFGCPKKHAEKDCQPC